MRHWTFDEPRRSEFETEEDYREAHDLYERMLSDYEDEMQEMRMMEMEFN